ncbi:hypothetical protein LIER_30968 [Lithospermum erythrorhizon]|uniref:Uncharacterized protein n=1 Tax=Lithospermum erythrorhizon TaxID=34254 RepID=A0AAV3RSN7_LITER
MNLLKCASGVASGKFVGFVVRRHVIEIEHAKIDAITALLEPRNLHELKSLQGKLAYLRRMLRAFQNVKEYLMSPPVLAAPIQGKPLILYVATQE